MPCPPWMWLCGEAIVETKREIPINTGEHNRLYDGNYTSTTKYNLLTFIPKALFEQYRRVALAGFQDASS